MRLGLSIQVYVMHAFVWSIEGQTKVNDSKHLIAPYWGMAMRSLWSPLTVVILSIQLFSRSRKCLKAHQLRRHQTRFFYWHSSAGPLYSLHCYFRFPLQIGFNSFSKETKPVFSNISHHSKRFIYRIYIKNKPQGTNNNPVTNL